jgi:protease-4
VAVAGCIGGEQTSDGCEPCTVSDEVRVLETSDIDSERIATLEAQLADLRDENTNPDGSIALVRLYGVLSSEDVGTFRTMLVDIATDDAYSAVVLWVDSPGGGVGATTQMYDEVVKLRTKKPVVVYSGDMIASGGYYLACGGDEIIVGEDCLVGNIGVIYAHTDATQYYRDFGLEITVIKTGEHKDMGADWRGLTEEEYNWFKDMVYDAYNRFVHVVAYERDMSNEDALTLSDGSIWLAKNARPVGLIDQIGDLEAAIARAEELAGLEKAEVVPFELWDEGSVKASAYFSPLRYQWEETLTLPNQS